MRKKQPLWVVVAWYFTLAFLGKLAVDCGANPFIAGWITGSVAVLGRMSCPYVCDEMDRSR